VSFKVSPQPDYVTLDEVLDEVEASLDATPSSKGTLYGYTLGPADANFPDVYGTVALGYNALKIMMQEQGPAAPQAMAIGWRAAENIDQSTNIIAIGRNALQNSVNSTTDTIVIGDNACVSISSAPNAVVIGHNAAGGTDTGTVTCNPSGSVVIGKSAGGYRRGDSTGQNSYTGEFGIGDSVVIGFQAVERSRDVTNTVVIGRSALSESQYQVINNVVIGTLAAQNKSGVEDSVVIGSRACEVLGGSLSSATVIGAFAGSDASGISYSIGIGHNAMRYANVSNSIGIGYGALMGGVDYIPSGNPAVDNVGIGHQALFSLLSGDENVCVGSQAARFMTSGSGNVVMGYHAGFNLLTDTGNVAVGRYALYTSTGSTNCVAIGENALGAGTSLSNVIGIGNLAQASSTTASNEIVLGNSSIATLRCQVTSITSLSDERDKSNIEDSDYGLEVVNNLRPVKFTWNMRDGGKTGMRDIGFTAQDLMQVEDALNAHDELRLTYRSNPDALEASYGRLIPVLVKAIQELSSEVKALKQVA